MSDMSDQPLSQLALSLMDADTQQQITGRHAADVAHVHDHSSQSCNHGWWSFLFFFLIAAIVFYFLYFALAPSFVLKNNCHSRSSESGDFRDREIDQNKLLGAALLSSLGLLLVLWLISVAYYWN